ncbi:MAG TPA: hypothetical protein VJ784_11335 [Pyrinomonadaceae bacterium]|nr:hypothetical protein [Pyrinomonadaceae bacterium]
MSRNYFRAFGALTLLLGPAILGDIFFRAQTQTQLLRGLFLLAAAEVVGFGLAFLRKWAALYFSIPLFCFGLWLAFVSISKVAFPLNVFAILLGIWLTRPLALTIRHWKELTWGRRFF